MDLCSIADVEALSGAAVLTEDEARVERLIEMASGVVDGRTLPLPTPVPPEVAMVTASLVVRQMANPTGLTQEGISGYSATYGAGMVLTDADVANLGRWAAPAAGAGAYSVALTRPDRPATWPVEWWQRDLDACWPPLVAP